jgi:hypothetical protein
MAVTAIVVHHSASARTTTPEDVRRWHKAKGWRDIGYHYLIRQPEDRDEPVLSMGRPHNLDDEWEPWEYGAHSKGENDIGVGICILGNFDGEPVPEGMWGLLVKQLVALCIHFGLSASAVKGHKEMPGASTACPGRYVTLDSLRNAVATRLRDMPL